MKYELTLKQLRKNGACIEGYNKLVSSLKGIEWDRNRKTYLRYKHKEPISLLYILENNSFDNALWCLRCNTDWDRDSRLFAVWCARQVQHLMIDKRSIDTIDVAERYASGEATREELIEAYNAASDYADYAVDYAVDYAAYPHAAYAAAYTTYPDASDSVYSAYSAYSAYSRTAYFRTADADADADADDTYAHRLLQKEMLIKMFSNEAPWQLEE